MVRSSTDGQGAEGGSKYPVFTGERESFWQGRGGSGVGHGKIKRQCKECGGWMLLTEEEDTMQNYGGSLFTTTAQRKNTCKECLLEVESATTAEKKSRCKECGGKCLRPWKEQTILPSAEDAVFVHDKRRHSCAECKRMSKDPILSLSGLCR
jgi:hypothetical protein